MTEEPIEIEKDPTANTVDKDDMMESLGLTKPTEGDDNTDKDPVDDKEDKTKDKDGDTKDLDNLSSSDKDDSSSKSEDDTADVDIDDLISDSDTDTSKGDNANDDDVDITKMSEKDAGAFKKQREEIKSLKEQLKTGVTELEELRKKVYATDAQANPEFQRVYVKPMQSKVQQIREMGKEFGLTEEVIKQASNLGFKDRKSLLMEEVPDISAELSIMFSELDSLNKARTGALADAKTSLTSLETQVTESRNIAFEATLESLRQQKMIPLLESKSKKWNDAVFSRIEDAKRAMINSGPEQIAEMALKASMANEYQTLVLRLQSQIRELQGKTKSLKNASPSIGGGRTDPVSSSKKADMKKAIAAGTMDIADALG